MKVIVDTSVWSLVLRRKKRKESNYSRNLSLLIDRGLVVMLGPIRQEILSGIKTSEQFNVLKKYLSEFPDFEILQSDYERAAELFNLCRQSGIQGSNTDFLICAVTLNHDLSIYTTDKDFESFQKQIEIKLYSEL